MSAKENQAIDQLAIDTIRTLSIDAIQKANSGHPGAPMGLAPTAYTLWQRFLRYDPMDPTWPNRDRFVLSAGHASMLLYSVLHLAGVRTVGEDGKPGEDLAVPIEDIEAFRQLDSRTPGHPEYHWTAGVETTTGPLGQGVATSVGMAMASKWLGAHFNDGETRLFDYDVYAICGDGDLMEGVAGEAASLAGHQRLDNLCWIYDNNHITIDGSTSLTYEDDVVGRFTSYGWQVARVHDANDTEEIAKALDQFKSEEKLPTMIVVDSHIGFGSPNKVDTASVHGEPLGEDEVKLTKEAYGWDTDAQFLVPEGVRERFAEVSGARGAELRSEWEQALEGLDPDRRAELDQMRARTLPDGWEEAIPTFEPSDALATRKASNKVENAVAGAIPWFLAGSADLTGSTAVGIEGAEAFEPGQRSGRQMHLGVREHGAAAVASGLALADLRVLWSTYLTFSDYARPAIRLSALMQLPVIHLFTHDSIGLGEDGPTHQPIEQLAALRAMPGLDVVRPCDANEVAYAWRAALDRTHDPVALVMTRQDVPVLDRADLGSAEGVLKGGYVLAAEEGDLEAILIATGSEVAPTLEAQRLLASEGRKGVRVVSLPCWEIFDRQDVAYQEEVLPPSVSLRLAVEAGSSFGWERYVGDAGKVVAMDRFGESAPAAALQERFGYSPESIAQTLRDMLA